MDPKKWLLDNFIFFKEIIKTEEEYYLEFCLQEEAHDFVKLCCKHNVPFIYFPPYNLAIDIDWLETLISKIQ